MVPLWLSTPGMDTLLDRLRGEREAFERAEKWLFEQLNTTGLQFDALVQRTESWHSARRCRLTASRFGVIAELSKHADAFALWELLIGEVEQDAEAKNNEHIRRGVEQESVAIQAYETITGQKVEQTGLFLYAEPYSYLGASPDGVLSDGRGLVEMKCPARGVTKMITDEYMAQVQGQLEICKREYCDFCTWHASQGLQVVRVYKSQAYWDWLLPQLIQFFSHFHNRTPPQRRSVKRDWVRPPFVRVEDRGFFPISSFQHR